MTFEEYPDREMLVIRLADNLAAGLRRALSQYGKATFCVPGGTTPGPVFDLLSAVDLDWSRVSVVLNDERWVPEDSPRSNTRLVRSRLLRGRAAAATLIPLYAPFPTPEEALDALSADVENALPIDVLLLGMGEDMHTASLFPGADRLADALAPDAPVLMALRADAAGEPRITLSARVLRDAMDCHILITGQAKRDAIEAAANLTDLEAPVHAVLKNATIHWAA